MEERVGRVTQGEVYLANVAARIGFESHPASAQQLVVVVQGNALNSVLESVLIVPLVPAARNMPRFSLDVLVPAAEIHEASDHVAPVHLLRPVALSRLEPGPMASISGATLDRLLDKVRRVFR